MSGLTKKFTEADLEQLRGTLESLLRPAEMGSGDQKYLLASVNGINLLIQGKSEEAEKFFFEAQCCTTENASTHYYPANTFRNLGRYKEAEIHARKAQERLNENDSDLKGKISKLISFLEEEKKKGIRVSTKGKPASGGKWNNRIESFLDLDL